MGLSARMHNWINYPDGGAGDSGSAFKSLGKASIGNIYGTGNSFQIGMNLLDLFLCIHLDLFPLT